MWMDGCLPVYLCLCIPSLALLGGGFLLLLGPYDDTDRFWSYFL